MSIAFDFCVTVYAVVATYAACARGKQLDNLEDRVAYLEGDDDEDLDDTEEDERT